MMTTLAPDRVGPVRPGGRPGGTSPGPGACGRAGPGAGRPKADTAPASLAAPQGGRGLDERPDRGDRGDHRGDRRVTAGRHLARAGNLGVRRAQAVRAVVPGVPARLALRAVPRPAGQGAVERVRAQPAPAGLGPAVAPAGCPRWRRSSTGAWEHRAPHGRAGRTTSTGRSSRPTTGARSPSPTRARGRGTTGSGASRCSRCSWRPRCSPSAGPRCCGTPGSSPHPSGPWDVLKYGFLGAYAFVTSMLIRPLLPERPAPERLRHRGVPDHAGPAHRHRAAPGPERGRRGRRPAPSSAIAFVIGFFPLVGLQAAAARDVPGAAPVRPAGHLGLSRSTSSTGSTSGTRPGSPKRASRTCRTSPP